MNVDDYFQREAEKNERAYFKQQEYLMANNERFRELRLAFEANTKLIDRFETAQEDMSANGITSMKFTEDEIETMLQQLMICWAAQRDALTKIELQYPIARFKE
ncbi:MAG: hypothetical protein LUE27_11470 [Clostridia bacterium]|nr:hypothetical protein [Clostridia bacterium]